MKVLLVDQYKDIGGGQTVFLQVLRALIAAGVEVETMMPMQGSLERAIRTEFGSSVQCHRIAQLDLSNGRKKFADARRLVSYSASLLKQTKLINAFDVVYVNGARLFPGFLALSSIARPRFVYHVHLDHSLTEKYVIGAVLAHPRTRAVLVNSSFVMQRLQASLPWTARSSRLRLVENCLPRRFSELPFFDRTDERPLCAVVPGRVVPEKGQDIVVDVAPAFPDIAFHILGDSDFGTRAYLENLKARKPANVHFHGYVSDIARAITELGAQLSLIPSRWEEPFGLTAIESMACSCLTITSGRGGLREISEKTGAWTCETMRSWTDALEKVQVMSKGDLAHAIRAQHEKVLLHYSAQRFEREIEQVFRAAVAT